MSIRSNVVRLSIPEATYFITTVTQNRHPYFRDEQNIQILRETLRLVKGHHQFTMIGYVFLPDHLHLLLRLLDGTEISRLMKSLKQNFTTNYKQHWNINQPTKVWQRSFYDHVIRNESDLQNHLNYIHYNPIKHGIVREPEAFRHSSFHEYVKREWYEIGWGHSEAPYNELTDGRLWEWAE